MMKYKAILFDLDGTLVDTSKGIFNAIRHAERILNLNQISEKQMQTHLGPSPEESFQRSFGTVWRNDSKGIPQCQQVKGKADSIR